MVPRRTVRSNAVYHQRHQSPDVDVDDEREEVAAVSPTMETNGSSSGRHITQHPKTAPTTYHHLIQEL